jgi:hypothetical protein
MLLAEIPGEDRYDAPVGERLAVLRRVHDPQLACAGRLDELSDLGVPDRRAGPLARSIRHTVHRYADVELVEPLLAGLEERLAELAARRAMVRLVERGGTRLRPGTGAGPAGAAGGAAQRGGVRLLPGAHRTGRARLPPGRRAVLAGYRGGGLEARELAAEAVASRLDGSHLRHVELPGAELPDR